MGIFGRIFGQERSDGDGGATGDERAESGRQNWERQWGWTRNNADEINADDMSVFLNSQPTGTNVFSGMGSDVEVQPDGSVKYRAGMRFGGVSKVLEYLKSRNQGKQAQEEYIRLLKERPGRQGTILTAGADPTIAQTIKTVLGTPNPSKTVLGA